MMRLLNKLAWKTGEMDAALFLIGVISIVGFTIIGVEAL